MSKAHLTKSLSPLPIPHTTAHIKIVIISEILFILSTKNPAQDGAARGNRYQLPYGFKEDWA